MKKVLILLAFLSFEAFAVDTLSWNPCPTASYPSNINFAFVVSTSLACNPTCSQFHIKGGQEGCWCTVFNASANNINIEYGNGQVTNLNGNSSLAATFIYKNGVWFYVF